MKISAIQNFYITPLLFTGNKTSKTKSLSPIKPDSFEKKQVSFEDELRIYYKQIKSDMGVVNKNDIKCMANRISRKTGVSINDVYETMGKLSTFSSYKSLNIIENYMRDNNIRIASNLLPYCHNTNAYNWPPALSNVMNYLVAKNFMSNYDHSVYDKSRKIVFIDSNLLQIIKNMPPREQTLFKKEFLKKNNHTIAYIKGFDNSYNFLNQGEDFETYTCKILEKAKIKHLHNKKGIGINVDIILDGKNFYDMHNLGIKAKILRPKITTDPKEIADNLNPIIPTEEEFVETVKDATYNPFIIADKQEEYVINFIKSMTCFVSPRQYCQYLKDINNKINNYIKENNRDPQKVYYLLPSNEKSYTITNYQYFKVNNIKNPKILYLERGFFDYSRFKRLIPKDSTVVILDDTAISALSYIRECFDYEKFAVCTPKKDNISYVVAPVFTTNYGLEKIKNIAAKSSRQNIDKVIYSKILPDWPQKTSVGVNFAENYLGPYLTSLVLPYMGPDSNCGDLIPLYEKFLYSKKAQKAALGIYDDIMI